MPPPAPLRARKALASVISTDFCIAALGQTITKADSVKPEAVIFLEINLLENNALQPVARKFRLKAIRLYQIQARADEELHLIKADLVSALKFFKDQVYQLEEAGNSDVKVRALCYNRIKTYSHIIHTLESLLTSTFVPQQDAESDDSSNEEFNLDDTDDSDSDGRED